MNASGARFATAFFLIRHRFRRPALGTGAAVLTPNFELISAEVLKINRQMHCNRDAIYRIYSWQYTAQWSQEHISRKNWSPMV